MAQRPKRRRSTRARQGKTPGWVWMFTGLAVGLSIAAAIHLKHRDDSGPRTPQPAPVSVDEPPVAPVTAPETPQRRFDFYELLPQFEVVVPETDGPARPDTAPEAVEAPGRYVLQAGSFSQYADADRMKASLALQGIESEIQRVQIDRDTYHRVRVGPFDNLERLNRVRERLREAEVEVLLIRMPD